MLDNKEQDENLVNSNSENTENTKVEEQVVEKENSENKPEEVTTKPEEAEKSEVATEEIGNNKSEEKENTESTTEEVETKSEEKEIKEEKSKTDFTDFGFEELTSFLKNIISSEPIQSIKNDVNELKINFNKKFDAYIATEKAKFIEEGGNEIDFHYTTPLKKNFYNVFNEYRDKVKHFYNQKEQERKNNYINKIALIEDLKMLISSSESSTMYNDLKEIQEKWRSFGPVPFEKNDDTWRTFRFHEQKVYDFLHLRSDFRNLDFKHNLEKKTKYVARAEELTKEPDNAKAFKELQILHRIWKEDVGPVAREFREEIWEKFSAATKIIHDKRRELFSELEAKWEENIPKKEEVIQKINELTIENITSHNLWQNKIKELETLRDEFFKIGKVTKEKKDELWESLREATRIFNQKKNEYYKDVKSEHQVNLDKKRALIEKALSLKDSEDFEETSNIYKKIQAEWKTIGHVPRKFSDKLWKEFRSVCNEFFDKMYKVQDDANEELMVVFNAKKEYLDKLKEDVKDVEVVALDKIKTFIKEWKEFGQVPQKMRFIESKFNKVIDKLFSKLDMDKNESIMLRFKNNIDAYLEQKNIRKLDGETFFIRKKIEEITKEIKLLENNLGFFKHTPKDNPLVKGVYKNIEKHQADLDTWKQKIKYLRSIDY